MLFSVSAFAQSKQKGAYTVYLNNPSGSIKAEVLYENSRVKAEDQLLYCWYSSNKIMETRGGYDGRLLSGSYTSFYLSDNLKEKGAYKNGLKNGEWKSWYESGRLKEIVGWKNGIKNGSHLKYDSRGGLVYSAKFKNGKLNGIELVYENDKILTKKKFSGGKEIMPKIKRSRDTLASKEASTPVTRKFKIKKNKTESSKNETTKGKSDSKAGVTMKVKEGKGDKESGKKNENKAPQKKGRKLPKLFKRSAKNVNDEKIENER
jgi:hypothetical protein